MGREKLTTKGRRDKLKTQQRLVTIKRLNAQPVVKKLNIEAIVAEFDKKIAQSTSKVTIATPQGASKRTETKKLTTKARAKQKSPVESTPKA